jgi:4-carboxymuconolactone decarboxylase
MTRVPLLNKEDLPQDKQDLYDQISRHRGSVARPFAALLNSPDVASKISALGEQLRYVSPMIAPDIREIITLTTARIMKCQYLWTHHHRSAIRSGVREEVVEAIREGGRPRRLLPKEAVFIQFTQELLESKELTPATFSAVEHLLGEPATIDMIVTIGYYSMLCLAINGLDVGLEEGVSPDL